MITGLQHQAVTKLKIQGQKEVSQGENTVLENDGDPFEVQYNPSEYGRKFEIEWEANEADGNTDGNQRFKRIKPSDLTLNVTLDGTGASGEALNVEEKVEELMDVAYNYQGDEHQPRILKVTWGTLDYTGVLQMLNVNYTLFSADGNPLRARLTLTLKSHKPPEQQVAENNPSSPDLTHLRTVGDGDTLPEMTYDIYGDSSYYLQVAAFNGITGFRSLSTGTEIYFPPLKDITDA